MANIYATYKPGVFLSLFFFPIFWCSHTDDHAEEELAKFGYNMRGKKNKIRILLYFRNLQEATVLNMAISELES